jgi:hypothetical protein
MSLNESNGNHTGAASTLAAPPPNTRRSELIRVGTARQDARARARNFGRELGVLVREADAAGLPRAEIAELGRLNRQEIHDLLRDRTPQRHSSAVLKTASDLHKAAGRLLDAVHRESQQGLEV